MNEKEKIFRIKITPALRDLSKLCRIDGHAFAVIIETEPGKTFQMTYQPERLTWKRRPSIKAGFIDNKPQSNAEDLNEENIKIARGIRAERG